MKWNYRKFLRNMFFTIVAPILVVAIAFIGAFIADWFYNLPNWFGFQEVFMWIRSKVTLIDEFDRKILEKDKKYWLVHYETEDVCRVLGTEINNYQSNLYPISFFDVRRG